MTRRTNHALFLLALLACSFLPDGARPVLADDPFLRGDVNADGRLALSDVLMLRRYLFNGFGGDRTLPCMDAADVDDGGSINISDAVWLIRYIFFWQVYETLQPPAPPYPEVGLDPSGLGCARYEVIPAEETDDGLRLGDFEGRPGDEVEIPIHVTSSRAVEGLQLVISYNPQVFIPPERPGDDAMVNFSFEGTFYEGTFTPALPPDLGAVIAYPEEGILTVGFFASFRHAGFELPAGAEVLVLKMRARIAESAPPGTRFFLTPTNLDGAGFGPVGLRNELTHRGESRFVNTFPRTIGGLGIVSDQTFFRFLRGDTNADGEVNISDAQHTLNHLFLGGPQSECKDAADANDDGQLDISDPITTLVYLFAGGPAISAPYPEPGPDPTPDGIDCA